MEIHGEMIFGLALEQRFATKFMQAADMFESFKVACTVHVMRATITNPEKLTYENAATIIKYSSEINDKECRVLVMHLIEIINGDTILRNTTPKVPPYFAPGVKVLSNGAQWWLIEQTLSIFKSMHKF